MANKEYTIYGLDCSSYMNTTQPNETASDFQLGLNYIISNLVSNAMKNRKSDRFGILIYNSSSFKLLYTDGQIELTILKKWYNTIKDFHDQSVAKGGHFDLISALNEIINQFKITTHLKYFRSVIFLTNGVMKLKKDYDSSTLRSFLSDVKIDINFILFPNFHTDNLIELIKTLPNTNLSNWDEFIKLGPSSKLINPIVKTTTNLSFSDLNLNVQVYPAIKKQNSIHGHEYYNKESDTITKVEKTSEYYISNELDIEEELEKEGDEEVSNDVEREIIDKLEASNGFKISNLEVVALVDELIDVSTLKTQPSINIIGFIKFNNLKLSYLTDESLYVIPNSSSFNQKNKIGFNSLIKSLLEMDYVALVRYVPKSNSEVELCAAYPQRVILKSGKFSYILMLVRLAMKEDEKRGRFYPLHKLQENEDEKKLERIDSLMENFIKSKKIRNDDEFIKNTLNNDKIRQTKSSNSTNPIDANTSLESILLSTNPATKRFNHYLNKTILKWMDSELNLINFSKQDKFIEKYLTVDEKYTLFNMDNILDANESYFLDKKEEDKDYERKLMEELNIKYKLQSKDKVVEKKRVYDFYGDLNEAHGDYDEYFDIDDILK
ncbi:unnamed protein product [Candida verbasci]|uniref:DNA helicase n=1 Tax=Candida verbasci TaxID=1227364 RepID=A0A9W4TS56_9ASCO|nr:unnamed protein product [Candida verbasci]